MSSPQSSKQCIGSARTSNAMMSRSSSPGASRVLRSTVSPMPASDIRHRVGSICCSGRSRDLRDAVRRVLCALAETADDPIVRRVLNRVATARAYLETLRVHVGLSSAEATSHGVFAHALVRLYDCESRRDAPRDQVHTMKVNVCKLVGRSWKGIFPIRPTN